VSWVALHRDGLRLAGKDIGDGLPVVFQHGLGGHEAQVAEVFPERGGLRRLTLDCRGHGRSPADDPRRYLIATFAEDVLAFADAQNVDRFVAGGISMGAAIALHLAVRHPARVLALILGRPAWLWQSAPANMEMYAEVAGHLRDLDPRGALAAFERSDIARRLAHEAPDNLTSMRTFLQVEDRYGLSAVLSAIASDGPGVSEADVLAITVPTLVLGTGMDVAHPLDHARRIASMICGAELVELTPKGVDRPRYVAEFRAVLSTFLSRVADNQGVRFEL
jgi:pimeloyl-ACP methyl ester carboxylesterase